MRAIEVIKFLNISPTTLRYWEQRGKIKSTRNEFNYRIYDEKDIERIKAKMPKERGKGIRLL